MWIGFVCVCVASGCSSEPPPAPPEQRMRVVQLDSEDRIAISEVRFDAFREALVRVREKESQRPVGVDGAMIPAPTLAAFNQELEAIIVQVIQIMRAQEWTRAERDLMNRALRRATIEDLRGP